MRNGENFDKGIAERFAAIRKKIGIKQADFAKALGITRGMISVLETGSAKLTERNIKAVCRTYNIDEVWLKTGQRDMFNPLSDHIEIQSSEEKELIRLFRRLAAETRRMVVEIVRKFTVSSEAEGASADKNDKKLDNLHDNIEKRA